MPPSRALPWLLVAALLVPATLPAVGAQDANQPPTVDIQAPTEGTTVNGTTTVEGTASDADGNVSHVEVRVDDGAWTNATGTENWTYEWDTTQHEDGNHSVDARSYDGQNYSAIDTVNVTVENGDGGGSDGDPPTVAIDQPPEGATVDGTIDVAGTASDPDGNVTNVRVRVDDAPWDQADGTSDWSSTWDTTTAEDGQHVITVEATDDDNRTATAERTVTVENGDGDGGGGGADGEPPTVTIDEPADGATVNGTVELVGTASDPDGNVSGVQAKIDDGFWSPANGTEEWSLAWDTASVEDGNHTVTVQAVDDQGATANATVNVTVANEAAASAPTVEIVDPEPDATVNGTVVIQGNATDPDGTVTEVEVRIGESEWQNPRGTRTWGIEWDLSDFRPGTFDIQVRAHDDDGNTANATRTIQIEESEPLSPTAATEGLNLTLEAPEDGETVEDELELAGEVQGIVDSNATARVSYTIDDGQARVIEVEGGGAFEETVNVTGLSPGEHELTVQAVHGESSSDTHTRTFETGQTGPEDVASPQVGLALLVVAVLAVLGLILWARR